MGKILLLFLTSLTINPLSASVFRLEENVIGTSKFITECTIASSQDYEYCITQLASSWSLLTGGKYGRFSFAYWQGTNQYSASRGECGLRFDGKNVRGSKGLISGNSTACFFSEDEALEVYSAFLKETRFEFYRPIFKNENRGYVFYTSDAIPEDDDALIAAYIHHINTSSKRTKYRNSYYGHDKLALASPWSFAKILARFKYYTDD